jgi:CRP-like cAMP-binding protein
MHSGDYFGEEEILSKENRQFSAVSESLEAVVWSLQTQLFIKTILKD